MYWNLQPMYGGTGNNQTHHQSLLGRWWIDGRTLGVLNRRGPFQDERNHWPKKFGGNEVREGGIRHTPCQLLHSFYFTWDLWINLPDWVTGSHSNCSQPPPPSPPFSITLPTTEAPRVPLLIQRIHRVLWAVERSGKSIFQGHFYSFDMVYNSRLVGTQF